MAVAAMASNTKPNEHIPMNI